MSPLARSLLALACAALLHASSADMAQRVLAELPNWDVNWPCATLDMGIENDAHTKKVELQPIVVSRNKQIHIPNVAKSDEALVGQHLFVCDVLGAAAEVILMAPSNNHSPVEVFCRPFGACYTGIIAFTDQYVIKKIV